MGKEEKMLHSKAPGFWKVFSTFSPPFPLPAFLPSLLHAAFQAPKEEAALSLPSRPSSCSGSFSSFLEGLAQQRLASCTCSSQRIVVMGQDSFPQDLGCRGGGDTLQHRVSFTPSTCLLGSPGSEGSGLQNKALPEGLFCTRRDSCPSPCKKGLPALLGNTSWAVPGAPT